MKSFVLFMLIAGHARAVSLTQYRTSPQVQSLQKIEIKAHSAEYEKLSNYFDKHDDLRLGQLKMKKTKELVALENKLQHIVKKIKTTDNILFRKGMSFNSLSEIAPHDPMIVLDDYKIGRHSDFYPDLVQIFEDLSRLSWEQAEGVRLSKDYRQLVFIKNGKESKKNAFNHESQCQSKDLPTYCKIEDLGELYISKLK